MALPKWSDFYSPILKLLEDGQKRSREEIADFVADSCGITPQERQIKVKGKDNITLYAVLLGLAYGKLKKSGQIHVPVENGKTLWGWYQIGAGAPDNVVSPVELMEQAYSELNDKLADDLLDRIMDNSPWFFERLVVDLLLSMGYGGADSDAGIVTQKSGDGGIDGVIKQDKLGFDRIYIQAKRWKPDSTVTKPEILQFYGALSGVKADRGLFITTAKFSQGAIDYANQQRIVLVDGERLTRLMIEYNVGVSTVAKYEIKAIDSDFFSNETA